jgi:hypothetical protein
MSTINIPHRYDSLPKALGIRRSVRLGDLWSLCNHIIDQDHIDLEPQGVTVTWKRPAFRAEHSYDFDTFGIVARHPRKSRYSVKAALISLWTQDESYRLTLTISRAAFPAHSIPALGLTAGGLYMATHTPAIGLSVAGIFGLELCRLFYNRLQKSQINISASYDASMANQHELMLLHLRSYAK